MSHKRYDNNITIYFIVMVDLRCQERDCLFLLYVLHLDCIVVAQTTISVIFGFDWTFSLRMLKGCGCFV